MATHPLQHAHPQPLLQEIMIRARASQGRRHAKSRRLRQLLGVLCGALVACGPPAARANDPPGEPAGRGLTVRALSRGKGVPPATRDAFRAVRDLLERLRGEGLVTRLDENRIGLEGETRLCVEFRDADATRSALEQVRRMTAGVELLNVDPRPCESR